MPMTLLDKVTLNDLIATTLDNLDGYLDAAENADSESLVALFDKRVIERQAAIDTLCREVIRLGGKPRHNGSLSASAHRIFFNLKSVLTGRSEQAIVEEVEKNEAHVKAKFEDAIADTELSPEVRRTIRDCYALIAKHNCNMSALKHSLVVD
jgi:uncharacterized protein (TIGR02284 family)